MTISLFVLFYQAKAQHGTFNVQGTITNSPASIKYLYLKYTDYQGKEVLDSSRVQNNSFSFEGNINEPTWAIVKANRKIIPDDENLNIVTLFLEPTAIEINVVYDHFAEAKVTGSTAQSEYELLNASRAPIVRLQKSLNQLNQQKQSNNTPTNFQSSIDSINHLIEEAAHRLPLADQLFIATHPNSYVSAYSLNTWKSRWPADTVRSLYNRLGKKVQESRYGQLVATKLHALDKLVAFTFSGTGLKGEAIKLSDYLGKYVLLDFWGSWCAPCRAGHPHLVELYKKYKDKGIEFISIACEDGPPNWQKAIEKDGIGIWRHLLDNQMKADSRSPGKALIQSQYSVDLYPTKILVDPKGNIVGRYVGGQEPADALDKKMEEIFK